MKKVIFVIHMGKCCECILILIKDEFLWLRFKICKLDRISLLVFWSLRWFIFFARCGNVFQLLARREVSPRTKRSSKKFWGEKSKCCAHSYELKGKVARDPRWGLISW